MLEVFQKTWPFNELHSFHKHMLFYISCVPPWEEYITDNRSGPGTDLLPRRGFTFLPVMRPSGIRLIHSTFKCQFSRNPHVPTVFGRLSGLCVSASLESHLTVSWCITLGPAMLILGLDCASWHSYDCCRLCFVPNTHVVLHLMCPSLTRRYHR